MIQVYSEFQKNGDFQSLLVRGHSGLAQSGTDIVCAAASVLVENLEHSLMDLLGLDVTVEKDVGYFRLHRDQVLESIQFAGSDRDAILDRCTILIYSALLGLKNLAGNFPEQVEFQAIESNESKR